MSQAVTERIIQRHLNDYWDRTPIVYENVLEKDWGAPGQPLLSAGEVDYLSVKIDTYSTEAVSIPANCRRDTGAVDLQVFVRSETGTRGLKEHLDAVVNLLEYKMLTLDGVWVRTSNVITQTEYPTDDGWYIGRIVISMTTNRYVSVI